MNEVARRLWRHFPSYLLAIVVTGIGLLMLLPSAASTMFGPWRWVFDWPGVKVWGGAFVALGVLHAVAWLMRWRIRYATMVLFVPTFAMMGLKLYMMTGVITPGTIVYLSLVPLALWVVRWHRLFE